MKWLTSSRRFQTFSASGRTIRLSSSESEGLEIVAGFDTNPSIIGTEVAGVPVYDVRELAERREALGAGIGIVTVPVECAQAVADSLVAAGVKALWNFTPFRIVPPEGIVIQNTSIYAHLAVMYNRMGASSIAAGGGRQE